MQSWTTLYTTYKAKPTHLYMYVKTVHVNWHFNNNKASLQTQSYKRPQSPADPPNPVKITQIYQADRKEMGTHAQNRGETQTRYHHHALLRAHQAECLSVLSGSLSTE